MAIANLEAELDLVLFDRGTREPTPTAAMAALLPDARSIAERLHALRAHAVGTRGRAGIGARLRFEWRSPRRRACSVREQREPTLCLTRRDRFPAHCVI